MKRIIALTLCLFVFSFAVVTPVASVGVQRDVTYEETLAKALKDLGLFKGVSENDFDLMRAPTRVEAMVMLIRILGKENEALSGNYQHPFVDVVDWADRYIGYAYASGLTKGVSDTMYGSGDASASMFLTFVLRALGYSDTDGQDFTWDNPFALAQQIGILTDKVDIMNFWRADVATVAFSALSAKLKGTDMTLAQKLISEGVFTQNVYDYVNASITQIGPDNTPTALSASEIYQKCSPAVFSIQTYDVEGLPYATGSGFFIDSSGLAVTNFHVLENALSATVTLSDGSVHEILGVAGYHPSQDYALLRIEGDSFTSLPIGDSSSLQVGSRIYTIGSPKGMQNTMSDGIISSTCRPEYQNRIQITAPISSGSSGGALLDEYGNVIGITTSTLIDSQNLNFAIPINEVIEAYGMYSPQLSKPYQSLRSLASYIAYEEYVNAPDFFDEVYNEIEPNDNFNEALFLNNGMSILGYIDDEYPDCYLIRCNTTGHVLVSLHSNSTSVYVNDLFFAMRKIDDDDIYAVSKYNEYPDGSASRYIGCYITEPGIYELIIMSSSLYEYQDINTDYGFYYIFTPDIVE